MGLTGFILMFQKAEGILQLGNTASTYLLLAVALIFILLTIFYSAKLILHFPAVRDEANNPVRLNFFPTFSISLLLLSTAFLEVNHDISMYLWVAGTTLQFIATVVILSLWVRQTSFELTHYNPAWFIPIVGNIIVPIAGVTHFSPELSWFFFSIGIVFWILLFAIFLYKIIFTRPLQEKMLPTFFILIAPPALGFISYVKLTGSIDSFAKILYYLALFLAIFLFAQIRMFVKIRFYLSWWAYSFPLASLTVATSIMLKQTGFDFFKVTFLVLAVILIVVITVLIVSTVKAILRGDICKKED